MQSLEQFPIECAPTLVRAFVDEHKKYTESPDEFLATIPLYLAGVLAGRWVKFNGQFLNNYYLIVGPTGKVKKTTAQDLAVKLLSAARKEHGGLDFEIVAKEEGELPPSGPSSAYPVSTHFSIEGLQAHALGIGTSAAISMGEYSTLFAIGRRQGQGNTIPELTSLYDGSPIAVKTLSRNSFAEEYAVSLLACSTDAWLADFCSDGNVAGGFVNRHLLIRGEATRIIACPEPPSDVIWSAFISSFVGLIPSDLRSGLQNNRVAWSATQKKVEWSPGLEKVWEEYYGRRVRERRDLSSDQLAEISARELTHATKLTGLSAFLEGRDKVIPQDLEFGCRFARWSLQNAISIISGTYKPPSPLARRIYDKLKKQGSMTRTQLQQWLGGKQDGFERAIKGLLLDEVVCEPQRGTLVFQATSPKFQSQELEKSFGKSDICELLAAWDLELGSSGKPEATG